ncbi:MAG TPA: hypothetical protein VGS41_01180, partial [Chthonomonadales bacterium]|nr:hypothetical protein [Chthonomonadales bacterium]
MNLSSLVDKLGRIDDASNASRLLDQAAITDGALESLLERATAALAESPQEAVHLTEIALELVRRRSDHPVASAAWRLRGQALRVVGRHSDAVAALDQAAEAARSAGNPRLAAQAQIGKIDSLGWLGRYQEATNTAKRLETELLALGAPEDAAKALVNLG